jgi:hypothetical protein
MTNPKPTEAGKARAASIHAEIDRLAGTSAPPLDPEAPANSAEKAPLSPREFIDQWMAEHDKKRES